MGSGNWIREIREERLVKSSDIERISRSIADIKDNANFYISHSTLADIETGSVPSIHKLFSLASCLKVSLTELLFVFEIDANELRQIGGGLKPGLPRSEIVEMLEPGSRFQLNFGPSSDRQETSLLKLDPRELSALADPLQKRLDPQRYRYAVVGSKDDAMGELIPPGALVEVDTMQNAVQAAEWRTMRERPVYLIWHSAGHSCCWCQMEGKDLILLPFPLSRQRVRRFKVPREASIIGRVTNAWASF